MYSIFMECFVSNLHKSLWCFRYRKGHYSTRKCLLMSSRVRWGVKTAPSHNRLWTTLNNAVGGPTKTASLTEIEFESFRITGFVYYIIQVKIQNKCQKRETRIPKMFMHLKSTAVLHSKYLRRSKNSSLAIMNLKATCHLMVIKLLTKNIIYL